MDQFLLGAALGVETASNWPFLPMTGQEEGQESFQKGKEGFQESQEG